MSPSFSESEEVEQKCLKSWGMLSVEPQRLIVATFTLSPVLDSSEDECGAVSTVTNGNYYCQDHRSLY